MTDIGDLVRIIDQLRAEPTQKWIAVNEQEPPKENGNGIAVCYKDPLHKNVHCLYWDIYTEKYCQVYTGKEHKLPFTHWMPLNKHINEEQGND